MSFGLSKDDFAPLRWRVALPYFLLIWLTLCALLGAVTYGMRQQLATSELRETERLLNRYLEANSTGRLVLSPALSDAKLRLHGLAFVRVISGDDRLLMAAEKISPDLFQSILQFEPHLSGPWLQLGHESGAGVWAVVSSSLGSGAIIHGGRTSTESHRLYISIVKVSALAALAGFILAWLAALIAAARMASPLNRLYRELDALISGVDGGLLPEGRYDSECERLYGRLNKLLQRNSQLVEEMRASLDNVAHDMRTPMTRLRSVAEFGLQEDSDPKRLRDSLGGCLEESERVLAMLKIMLSVAEAETGTMRLERVVMDVHNSIREMISLYDYVAEDHRITVTTEFYGDEIPIYADRTRIAQVWANLLDNGIKYGREGGWLRVESEVAGSVVTIHFRDNGIGISENEQPRIWERLYRGDRSRSQQGLGLGLNYVSAVVEAHGGRVTVKSALNEGSCFTVTLPLANTTDSAEMLR